MSDSYKGHQAPALDKFSSRLLDSRGRAVALTFSGEEAYRDWARESKATDQQGRPLVLFHGTAYDIDQFQIAAGSDEGIYFTPSVHLAGDFALNRTLGIDDAPVVYAVYLSIQNPLIIGEYELSYWLDPDDDDDEEAERDWSNMPRLIHNAKTLGHDGLLLRGVREHDGTIADQWIAFTPEQIISAIGDAGRHAMRARNQEVPLSVDLVEPSVDESSDKPRRRRPGLS